MVQYRTLVGATATKEEVDTFVELVGSGGAVDENHVRRGAVRQGAQIIFAEVDGQTVGVAALKVPLVGYRTGLQGAAKADYSLPESQYPYELGYISVSPKHSGQGIAKALVAEVLRLANGKRRITILQIRPYRQDLEERIGRHPQSFRSEVTNEMTAPNRIRPKPDIEHLMRMLRRSSSKRTLPW